MVSWYFKHLRCLTISVEVLFRNHSQRFNPKTYHFIWSCQNVLPEKQKDGVRDDKRNSLTLVVLWPMGLEKSWYHRKGAQTSLIGYLEFMARSIWEFFKHRYRCNKIIMILRRWNSHWWENVYFQVLSHTQTHPTYHLYPHRHLCTF